MTESDEDSELKALMEKLSNHPMVLAAGPERSLPLTVAATAGADDILEFLLDHGLVPNERNEDGTTALSRVTSLVSCKLLTDAGARVSAERPEDGMTSLHYTAMMDCSEVVRHLLSVDGKLFLSVPDKMGYSPLHYAASEGNNKVAEILLDSGADPNLAGRAGGKTPTQRAISPYLLTTLKLLLNRGGRLSSSDVRYALQTYGPEFAQEVKRLIEEESR